MDKRHQEEQREFGVQPIESLLERLDLSNRDLVEASSEQLTHKQVQKARNGRKLSGNLQGKVLRALNVAACPDDGKEKFELRDIFNYITK
jgi:hypothetical protein